MGNGSDYNDSNAAIWKAPTPSPTSSTPTSSPAGTNPSSPSINSPGSQPGNSNPSAAPSPSDSCAFDGIYLPSNNCHQHACTFKNNFPTSRILDCHNEAGISTGGHTVNVYQDDIGGAWWTMTEPQSGESCTFQDYSCSADDTNWGSEGVKGCTEMLCNPNTQIYDPDKCTTLPDNQDPLTYQSLNQDCTEKDTASECEACCDANQTSTMKEWLNWFGSAKMPAKSKRFLPIDE